MMTANILGYFIPLSLDRNDKSLYSTFLEWYVKSRTARKILPDVSDKRQLISKNEGATAKFFFVGSAPFHAGCSNAANGF